MSVSRTVRCLALALSLALGGCKREPPVVLDHIEVVVEGDDGLVVLGLSTDEVRVLLEKALAGKGFVLPAADGRPPSKGTEPWKYSFAVGIEAPDSQHPRARVRAIAVLKRSSGDGTEHELQLSASEAPKGEGLDEHRDAAQTALKSVIKEAAARMSRLVALTGMSDATVAQQLKLDDLGERDLALRVLAERKSAIAVEPLMLKLKTDDLTEARRAIGLLLQIGDRRAVPALIEAAAGKDPVFQREIVFALGALGGDEAEAYLTVMAEGHDQPLMRASAGAALDEMKARRDGGR